MIDIDEIHEIHKNEIHDSRKRKIAISKLKIEETSGRNGREH